jgi:simple sugar transport system ATP-binding protein
MLEGIVKRFGDVVANDGVDLQLGPGEIHGLLGENGAGKTTLMRILSGVLSPDEGSIEIRGERVTFRSARDAIARGIGMVHQHFMLVPEFTVAENLILGRGEPRQMVRLDEVGNVIRQFSVDLGLPVEPRARVGDLPVGTRQRIEIVKALFRGSRVLILDEPTSVLTPTEVDELLATLRGLAAKGTTIVFISHRIDEVMQVTDHITVMRDGRVTGSLRTADTNPRELAWLMVGREISERIDRLPTPAAETAALELERVDVDGGGGPGLVDVSLSVQRGEVLGIAGVDGNGQLELGELIAGLRSLDRGTVRFHGRSFTEFSPRAMTTLARVGYIPGDRERNGIIGDLTLAENLALDVYRESPLSHRLFLSRRRMVERAESLLAEYRVRAAGPEQRASQLSGGNQQKLLLARILSRHPDIIVAVNPTRGLDVAATRYTHEQLLQQARRGAAVLLISTDLNEVISLSNRIAVIYEGRLMDVLSKEELSTERLGLLMAGISPGAETP